jgi:CBS domain-containing protein
MIENNIRHMPVVEGGRLVGVISIKDVLRTLLTAEAFP